MVWDEISKKTTCRLSNNDRVRKGTIVAILHRVAIRSYNLSRIRLLQLCTYIVHTSYKARESIHSCEVRAIELKNKESAMKRR